MTDMQVIKMFMGFLFVVFGAIAGEVFAMIGAVLLLTSMESNKKRVPHKHVGER